MGGKVAFLRARNGAIAGWRPAVMLGWAVYLSEKRGNMAIYAGFCYNISKFTKFPKKASVFGRLRIFILVSNGKER
jgi:hypothetical protein